MSNKQNDVLIGMSAICIYYGNVSAPTILNLIRTQGFPATKMDSNTWKSSKSLITEWNQEKIKAELGMTNHMFEIETRPEISEIQGRKTHVDNDVKRNYKEITKRNKKITKK